MRQIDADELLLLYEGEDENLRVSLRVIKQNIKDAPTIEAEQTKHGTWGENIYGYRKCSVCGRVTQVDECMREPLYLYCPYCGADMREVEK